LKCKKHTKFIVLAFEKVLTQFKYYVHQKVLNCYIFIEKCIEERRNKGLKQVDDK